MTPSSRPDHPPHRGPRPRACRGFTLVELLVVIGIILVLISILLPAVNRAHLQAVRTSMMADLSVISQALDQYHNDFGDYPRTGYGNNIKGVSGPITGAEVLCWALVAPGPAAQDGVGQMNGTTPASPDLGAPGFTPHISGQGKAYGPYVSLDRFRIGTWSSSSNNNAVTAVPSGTSWDDTTAVLSDRYGNLILYYPAKVNNPPSLGFVGSYDPSFPQSNPSAQYVYNYGDNAIYTYPSGHTASGESMLSQNMFEYRLGNVSESGKIQAGEVPVVVPYLLWSAGPDGQFGPQVNSNGVTTGEDDDIVYPDQLQSAPVGVQP